MIGALLSLPSDRKIRPGVVLRENDMPNCKFDAQEHVTRGLFMDGARWDDDAGYIVDSFPKVIHLLFFAGFT